MRKKEPLPKTIENTLYIFCTVVIFLLIISAHDSSYQEAIQAAKDASHGELPKPPGHGR